MGRLINTDDLQISVNAIEVIDGKRMIPVDYITNIVKSAPTGGEEKTIEVIGQLVDSAELLDKLDELELDPDVKYLVEYELIRKSKWYNSNIQNLGIKIINPKEAEFNKNFREYIKEDMKSISENSKEFKDFIDEETKYDSKYKREFYKCTSTKQ